MLLDNFRRLLGGGFVSSIVPLMGTNNSRYDMTMYDIFGNSSNIGILIGDSDSPVASSQYQLGSQITSGISQTNKSQFVEKGSTNLKTFYRFSSVITNTSATPITIKEIGLAHMHTNYNILLIREVVEPYVLEPGESVQMLVTLE